MGLRAVPMGFRGTAMGFHDVSWNKSWRAIGSHGNAMALQDPMAFHRRSCSSRIFAGFHGTGMGFMAPTAVACDRSFSLLSRHVIFGNGQRGVHPPFLQPNGGIGKTRLREALPRAPTCLKFNYDALARSPQPMPTTQTFHFIFSGTLLRLRAPRRRRGLGDPVFSLQVERVTNQIFAENI